MSESNWKLWEVFEAEWSFAQTRVVFTLLMLTWLSKMREMYIQEDQKVLVYGLSFGRNYR